MDKASLLRKLLSFGSQTAPEVIEEAAPIAKRVSTQVAEVAPEVIGKGARTASKIIDPVDASWRELTPEPKKVSSLDAILQSAKENPKTAALLTSLAGGVAVNSSLNKKNEQPISSTSEPMKAIEPKKPEEIKKELKKTVPTEEPKPDGLDFDALAKKFDQDMASLPKEEAAPIAQEPGNALNQILAEGLNRQSQGNWEANLLRASEKLGAGLSRTHAEHGSSDIRRKEAEKELSNAKEMVETSLSQQRFDKAQAELGDETAMRDPNSNISKMTTAIAQELGLIKPGQSASAMALKNAGLNLGTLLATKEAGKARKEAAILAHEASIKGKADKLNEQQRKFAQGLRKEATTGVLGKQYATFATGQRMQNALDQFTKDPSGYKDYATLMGGLKSLQGDESVVREAEVRLGMNATSAINKIANYLQSAMNGKQLQPEQRQQMVDTIKILTDASKQQYMHSVQPILEQAKMEGVDPEIILSGSLSGINKSAEQAPTNNSIEMVRVIPPATAGNPNPKAKLIPKDQLENAIAAGGKLVQ